jgi:phosphopentomutase
MARAAGAVGRGDRGLARQGHALGPLGTGRRAGAVGVALFSRHRARPFRPTCGRDLPPGRDRGHPGQCHAAGIAIMRIWAPSICAPAGRSATPRPTACSRSPRMRRLRARPAAALCAALAPTVHAMRVGRVIARPFVGGRRASRRTGNRRDYAIAPPAPTLLDWAQAAGRAVHAVGKIGDIFSHRGIDRLHKGPTMRPDSTICCGWREAEDGALTFANFVEFDSLYGHRATWPAMPARWNGSTPRWPALLAAAAARRSDDLHRRSRQRPDLARHRPHPRAGAGAGLPGSGRRRSGCAPSPMSAPRSPRIWACRPGPGRSFL